jgi:outer membrane protein TolC
VTLAFGQEKDTPLALSLEDCVLRAMKNNLAVAIQVLNPEISVASVSRAQEKFYPSLSFSFNKRNTDAASYSYLDAAESVINKLNDYSVQLNETIPGGGSLGLSLNTNKNDSNRSFQTINPRFGSTLTLSFSQPLLKDFGWDISRREILIARNNLAITENQLEQTLMETIYSVEDAYWNLVYSIDNLEVRRRSLKLAQDLLDKNRRSVEVGQLAPIEVLSAQAEVATREADILQAEALVKNNEDRLKMILNLSMEEEKTFTSIQPKDKPKSQETKMALDEALVTAMENRPELRASRIGLKNQELNVTYAKNQLLPGLNLTASYWSPGVSGEQIIYLNNNPLTGIIIGRIPGGSSAAMKDAFNFKYQNWSVGLTLTLPLNNLQEPGAADLPGDQERRSCRRDQLQTHPGLSGRPGTGRAETRCRRREAQGRTEHQLHGPPVPKGPVHRPQHRAQGHRGLQPLYGCAGQGARLEPQEQGHEGLGFRQGELTRACPVSSISRGFQWP